MGLVFLLGLLWVAYQIAPAETKAKFPAERWVLGLASLVLIAWVFRGGSLWIAAALVLLWAAGRFWPAFIRSLRR